MSFRRHAESELWRQRQAEADEIHDCVNGTLGDDVFAAAGGALTCVGPRTGTVFYVSPCEVSWATGLQLEAFLRRARRDVLIDMLQRGESLW